MHGLKNNNNRAKGKSCLFSFYSKNLFFIYDDSRQDFPMLFSGHKK